MKLDALNVFSIFRKRYRIITVIVPRQELEDEFQRGFVPELTTKGLAPNTKENTMILFKKKQQPAQQLPEFHEGIEIVKRLDDLARSVHQRTRPDDATPMAEEIWSIQDDVVNLINKFPRTQEPH